MNEPLISCVIPCFNGERFLRPCIESLLAQTHRALEVIVVDDGSTDSSELIARSYGGSVRYHRRENGGPAAACNTGVALSTGDYVAFLEQDDLWLTNKLQRQIEALLNEEALGYCVTYIQNFWSDPLSDEAVRFQGHPVMRPVPGYVVQTLLARRRAFDVVGLFDESLRFACASDWFMRAEEANVQGKLLEEVLTLRRLHDSNFSRQNRAASHAQFLHVIKSMLDRRRDHAASVRGAHETGAE